MMKNCTQHVAFGARDGGEHGTEGGLAVDVQGEPVTAMHRGVQHAADGVVAFVGDRRGCREHPGPGRVFDFLVEHEEAGLSLSVQVDITAEVAGAEKQVGNQGHIGQQHQPEHPGERALRRTGVHDRMHGGEDTGHVQRNRRDGDHRRDHWPPAPAFHAAATVFVA